MQLLAKLLKALNSDDSPWQLAFGVMLGMIMGLTPFLGLHSIIILFIVCAVFGAYTNAQPDDGKYRRIPTDLS